jgi:DNA processing protein
MKSVPFLLDLHRRLNLTKPRFEKLSQFFEGDWQKAAQATIKDWQKAGVDGPGIEKFFGGKSSRSPAEELALLQASGARLVVLGDQDYPDLWHNIAQAPALFFYKGNGDNLNTKSVAVVGSRKMTDYGHRIMQQVLSPVFTKGITVVSGLAYGVDAAAHQLAIASHAPAVAVLGNGIDQIYPQRNTVLAKNILESGGTLVSEYLPQTEARPEYFPQRNRLVAGLSDATVVVEGALKSGSLITARLANDFGRSVWAVPGDIFRVNSAGCNQLIFQGEAAALTSAEFLLESLNLEKAIPLHKIDLTSDELVLVKKLRQKNTWTLDDFMAQFSWSTPEISTHLTLLELKGVLKVSGDKVYLC